MPPYFLSIIYDKQPVDTFFSSRRDTEAGFNISKIAWGASNTHDRTAALSRYVNVS